MRSLAPFGMSLRGVGTGRCVRASTGRADDAETCSGFVLGTAPVPLWGSAAFSGGNNCEGGNAGE